MPIQLKSSRLYFTSRHSSCFFHISRQRWAPPLIQWPIFPLKILLHRSDNSMRKCRQACPEPSMIPRKHWQCNRDCTTSSSCGLRHFWEDIKVGLATPVYQLRRSDKFNLIHSAVVKIEKTSQASCSVLVAACISSNVAEPLVSEFVRSDWLFSLTRT